MIQKAAQPSKAWTAKSSVDGRLKSARLALKKIGPHDPRHVHADSGDPSGTITRVCARSSERKFMKLATAYLSCYPSDFYTLREVRNRQTDPPAKTREGYLAVHHHNNMLYYKRLEQRPSSSSQHSAVA
jgi:hypothetical protein